MEPQYAKVRLPEETQERIGRMVKDEVERCAKPYAEKVQAYEGVLEEIGKMESSAAESGDACGALLLGQVLRMFREAGWEQ